LVAFTRLGRIFEQLDVAVRGWQRLEGIPTARFNEILNACLREGWRKCYEYENFDSWIDYGRVDVRHGYETLRFEWTNWLEGEISGAPSILREIGRRYELT
jgi:hypothetical protein